MSPVNLTKRVELLEETVDGPDGLVAQVDRLRGDVSSLHMDFLQFKDDTRVESSAVRGEMRSEFSAVRHEVWELRQEMRAEFVAVRSEMNTRFEDVDKRFDGLQAGLDQTRTEMRVLHEEVISRISLLGERLHDGAGS